jgi:phosphatidylinositol glycan class W
MIFGLELEIQRVTSICYFSFILLLYTGNQFNSEIYRFLYEFIIFILPQLVVVLWPEWWGVVALALISMSLVGFLLNRSDGSTRSESADIHKKVFLENSRAFVMVQTFLSILAVDFVHVYPSRFAKTTSTGVSLMDVGVGYYVASSAQGITASRTKGSFRSFLMNLVWKCMALFLIGTIRFVSIFIVGYSYSVSEYGIHWNFFTSLSCIFFIALLMERSIGNTRVRIGLGCAIIIIQQYFLSARGLSEWIHSKDRDMSSWISMNKEGIFSIPGYLFIYTGIQSITEIFLSDFLSKSSRVRDVNSPFYKLGILGIVNIVIWGMYILLYEGLLPCRKEANLTYGLWIIASYTTHILISITLDVLFGDRCKTVLFRSINRNPLVTFLVANILTGMMNMYFPISPSNIESGIFTFILLLLYMLIVCSFSFVLDTVIDTRLW